MHHAIVVRLDEWLDFKGILTVCRKECPVKQPCNVFYTAITYSERSPVRPLRLSDRKI